MMEANSVKKGKERMIARNKGLISGRVRQTKSIT
jgi:hypothetical protein